MWLFFSELCNEGLAIKLNYAVNIFFMLLSAPFLSTTEKKFTSSSF